MPAAGGWLQSDQQALTAVASFADNFKEYCQCLQQPQKEYIADGIEIIFCI
jgi:hypothetical protein